MSPPEVRLWQRLRTVSDGGLRWRRQHPLGPYVLDFYCPMAKLAVEVDGWGHNMGDHPQRDETRDAWLTAAGLTLVRIAAPEVMTDVDEIEHNLSRQALALYEPPPSRR